MDQAAMDARRRRPPEPDAHQVQAGGLTLWIQPCQFMAADAMVGSLTPYQAAVDALAESWRRADLFRTQVDGKALGDVAWGAVASAYDLTQAELDALLAGIGPDAAATAVVALAAAACGRMPSPLRTRRRRALYACMLGLDAVPLSPDEMAILADWAENSGRAPRGG